MSRVKNNKIVFYIINVIAFAIFLLLNFSMELSADDIDYQYIFWTNERVDSLADIFVSQARHYVLWGGRSVVHFLDQFFLMFDKVYFDFANSVVFLVFILLIYFYAFGKKIANDFLLLEYFLIWTTIPDITNTLLWQTGSINYLWGSTLILLFILPYFLVLEKNREVRKNSRVKNVGMFLFGIISGWTLEVGGFMLILTILWMLLYHKQKRQCIYNWEYWGLIGTLIGFITMIIAPGNFARADIIIEKIEEKTLLEELLFRIMRESYYMLVHMWPLFICIVGLILISKKNNIVIKEATDLKHILLLGFTAFMGVYAMTASPAYAERVLTTPIAYMIVLVGILYRIVIDEPKETVIDNVVKGKK